ncbi:MAG: sodium-dependent transporter [Cellulosilyticum sp.]|nr:sodium-dependent transporter [Cellulosilyticum sp.]
MNSRDGFNSKLGIIAAAAGSAIGLGNIWKFPYMAGQFGGGAFILIYILAIILMGYPLIYCEFALGRKAKSNAVDTYGIVTQNKKWNIIGYIGVGTVFLITTFYMMITGWVIYYLWHSITGNLYTVPESVQATEYFAQFFTQMNSSMWAPLIFALIAICLTGWVNAKGIGEGVEKYSKIMMPILFIIFIILIVYSMTLDGFKEAFNFLFKPDLSAITPTVIISAIGQAFFSLSIGMGALVTYGSYISEKEDLRQLATQVSIADTIIALFAGLLIFPAVFTYNLEPTAGPSLIFISLPEVFLKMPGGRIFSILFFVLIIVAAITSMISMLEIMVTFVDERTKLSRKSVTWLIVFVVSIGGMINIAGEGPLSFIKFSGKTIFECLDYFTNNITIPLVAVLTAVVATWIWKIPNLNKELTLGGRNATKSDHFFNLLLKWVIPPTIIILMVALLLGVQA